MTTPDSAADATATTAATTEPAPSPTPAPSAAPQEPSQEAILSELQKAEKEGRPASIDVLGGKAEPAAPTPQTKDDRHETELQKKFGAEYIAKQERSAKKAGEYRAKIDAMVKRIAEIEAKWEDGTKWKDGKPIPESQVEYIQDNIEYKNLKKDIDEKTAEYDEKVAEYREGVKNELMDLYASNATFKAQHDHYHDMVFKKLDGADKFSGAIMDSPDRMLILQNLYNWLDKNPNGFTGFVSATAEQRMTALGMLINSLRFKPRVVGDTAPATAPAAPSPAASSPAAPPQIKAPSINPDPNGLGGGGGLDLSKQEDAYKYILQREKETGRRMA
jgi:hypothetical protein